MTKIGAASAAFVIPGRRSRTRNPGATDRSAASASPAAWVPDLRFAYATLRPDDNVGGSCSRSLCHSGAAKPNPEPRSNGPQCREREPRGPLGPRISASLTLRYVRDDRDWSGFRSPCHSGAAKPNPEPRSNGTAVLRARDPRPLGPGSPLRFRYATSGMTTIGGSGSRAFPALTDRSARSPGRGRMAGPSRGPPSGSSARPRCRRGSR